MLKKLRVALAWVFWIGITLLLLDFTGALHGYLGWMAKVQFLPAVLALNVGVIVALAALTLVCGRVYCSVICPLGVFQDGISWLGTHRSKKPYQYKKENKWLRYGVWALFVVALVAGVQALVALLAPYSAYGRMVQNLLQPVYLWGNNLLAALSQRAGSYTFYEKEVWIRSVPTFVVAVATLAVVVALSLKGGRTYCNSICPVGTTLSFLSRFAMFRPLIDHDKCKHCKACELHCKAQCIAIGKDTEHIDHSRCVDCFNCIDQCKFGALKYRFAWGLGAKTTPSAPETPKISETGAKTTPSAPGRRAMMAGTVAVLGAAALKGIEARAQEAAKKVDGGFAEVLPKRAPERETPLTPPGSQSVKDFYRRCTGCQLCVAECPNNVLRPSTDLEHLMQPCMSFEKGFCRPECTRCSELCPAGAIRKIGKEEKTQYHVGTARVNVDLCLEATGRSQCGKCAQSCPTGAIVMVEHEELFRRPAVTEEVCIGCGKCEYLCPVRPISAIVINGKTVHISTQSPSPEGRGFGRG
ncbi:MAG: 4Fe-4S binding protein [Bacteroidales bacterium]|nr:4Fe-4S binding protein [Bacteroidales bacterium]